MLARVVLAFASIFTIHYQVLSAEEHVFFRENVLGTSLELRVNTPNFEDAVAAETVALVEIERQRAILSSYDSSSELARFMASPVGKEVEISDDLFAVLEMCDEWSRASSSVFNPAAERLSQMWMKSADSGRTPTSVEIQSAIQQANQPQWKLNKKRKTARRLSQCPLSLNAIAKGVILDRVAQKVLQEIDKIDGVTINIGGDIRIAGQTRLAVAIADPRNDSLGGTPLARLTLTGGAVATSGSSERSIRINGVDYSHLIDPRNGRPVSETVSATVVAPAASTADALATICGVLSMNESLALVNSIPGAECLLFSARGVAVSSANWLQTGSGSVASADADSKKLTGHEMLVEFEISNAGQSRRYRRPYVAVWIEDQDKFPVRTLSLFLMQNNPGPRWYRDVRRWYADDQMRKLVESQDVIATVSKPTRNPGKYKVKWDGRDSSGKLVKDGKYTLLIEAAREHGTYQLIKQEFEFGKSFKKELKGNVEIATASIVYVVNE